MLQGQWQFGMFEIDAALVDPHVAALADRAVRGGADSLLRALSLAALQGVRVPAGPAIQPGAPAQAAIAARAARCRHRQPWRLPLQCRALAGRQTGRAGAAAQVLLRAAHDQLVPQPCRRHGELRRAVHRRRPRRRDAAGNCSIPRCSGPASSSSCSSIPCCSRSATSSKCRRSRNRIRAVDPTFFGWAICLCLLSAVQRLHRPLPRVAEQRFSALRELRRALRRQHHAADRAGDLLLGVGGAGLQGQQPHQSRHHQSRPVCLSCGIPPTPPRTSPGGSARCPTCISCSSAAMCATPAYALLALCGWTTIYALRAITEERHLLLLEQRLRAST